MAPRYGIEDGGFGLREDAIPEGYNLIFIIVNLYYVLRWALNRIDALGAALLEPVEAELYERCFEPLGVRPYQYLKLLKDASWVDVDVMTTLTVEGEPVRDLFVSLEGDFDVVSGGQRVASSVHRPGITMFERLELAPRGNLHVGGTTIGSFVSSAVGRVDSALPDHR